MEFNLLEWLNLILRWLHVITAIAWIGASFYFIWLDNSLAEPPLWKKDKGVSGDLWAFHGGGIYEVAKYSLAPEKMPDVLHWFKWEAYATWISGALLLSIVYYFQADLYLRGENPWLDSTAKLITASILFIFSGTFLYELLIRSPIKSSKVLLLISIFCLVSLSSWLSTFLFSGRAAFLHVGAMMATIMAMNVFLGIMPAQRKFVQAVEKGLQPNKASMLFAKLRSVHNNYFTLPVLFCMLSNHYAFLYTHQYNWVVLIVIMATTAYARHFFNLRHQGIFKPQILLVSVIIVFGVFLTLAYLPLGAEKKTVDTVEHDMPSQVTVLMQKHCVVCHSVNPSQPGFSAPPAGLSFDTLATINGARDKIIASVESEYMPLGNVTMMTEAEREALLNILKSQ